jgi:2-O-methyltransferase
VLDPIFQKLYDLPDDVLTILDVGANSGKEIPLLKQRWPAARIIAIEPNPEPFAKLREHEIECHNIALSHSNGKALFYPSTYRVDLPHTGSSSLRKPKEHLDLNADVSFGEPFSVITATLDSFCKTNAIESIDLLWMDVQGCEGDIVDGSKMTENIRYIYTESYENEMYEGQKKRPELLRCLPTFSQVELGDKYNILLKNDCHAR